MDGYTSMYADADEQLFDTGPSRRPDNPFFNFGTSQSREQQKAQRYATRADQTIPERFVSDVKAFYNEHRIRHTDNTWIVYEDIARRYGRANYLNPAACVLAITRTLDTNMRVRPETLKLQSLRDECEEHDLTILDVVRYAELIQLLFTI
jgi:hypothetical protein